MLLTERQPKNVEHSPGDGEGQKLIIDESHVDTSISTEEQLAAEDTQPGEDSEKDELEDDAVEKEV